MSNFSPIPVSKIRPAYVNGFNLTWLSNATFEISAGCCSDVDNNFDIASVTALKIDTAIVGAGGIDAGSLAASKVYSVFSIGDPVHGNPTKAIISLSSSVPYMPANYLTYRRIGFVRTDASSHILQFFQSGLGSEKTYMLDSPLQIVSAGTQTSFTSVDLTNIVPLIDGLLLKVQMEFTPAAAGDQAYLRCGSSTAGSGYKVVGQVAATIISEGVSVIENLVSGVPTVQYKVSAGSLAAYLIGFVDSL